MSFRPRSGIMAMMATVAAAFAGMTTEQRQQYKAGSLDPRRDPTIRFTGRNFGNNKRQHRKMVQRRTRNKLARISRRDNRS